MPQARIVGRPTTDTITGKRIKEQAEEARELIEQIPEADRDALTEAVILQGVASGNWIAASVRSRLKLANENLRLKTRIARIRERIAVVKLRLLEAKVPHGKEAKTRAEINEAILEIYGIK